MKINIGNIYRVHKTGLKPEVWENVSPQKLLLNSTLFWVQPVLVGYEKNVEPSCLLSLPFVIH